MNKINRGRNLIMSFLIFFLLFSGGCNKPDKQVPKDAKEVKVKRVVDGDTFETTRGERVRLLGVDTPESVKPNHPVEAYGKEASEFTKKLIEGETVYLTFDVEPKDQYGRTLAYLFLQNGTFFNKLLIKEGYAQVLTIPPNVKYQDIFLEEQRYAREKNKGLWGLADTKKEMTKLWVDESGKGLIKGSKSMIYHMPGGEYYDKTTNVRDWFKTEQDAIDSGYRRSKK